MKRYGKPPSILLALDIAQTYRSEAKAFRNLAADQKLPEGLILVLKAAATYAEKCAELIQENSYLKFDLWWLRLPPARRKDGDFHPPRRPGRPVTRSDEDKIKFAKKFDS